MMLGKLLLLSGLSVLAFIDLKERELPLWLLGAWGGVGMICDLAMRRIPWWSVISGMAIGLVVWILAWITKEKIGIGDAYVLLVTGIYLGFWSNLALVTVALMGCGMTSLVLIVSKRCRGTTEIPFVPFLLVALLFVI